MAEKSDISRHASCSCPAAAAGDYCSGFCTREEGDLDALVAHFDGQKPGTKVIVWERNSHLGDVRATEPGRQGQLNVGRFVRERYGRESVPIGFSTPGGAVTAASNWGGMAGRRRVRPVLEGSYEVLFNEAEPARVLLTERDDTGTAADLRAPRPERAVGVIYHPETERGSHYSNVRLSEQFDVVLHFDKTRGQAAKTYRRVGGRRDAGDLPLSI